jgi:hypothetical protein
LAPSYGSARILFGKKRKKKEVTVFVCFFGRLILVAFKDYTVGKKKLLTPLFFYVLGVARHLLSSTLLPLPWDLV